jgi:hypothetical protein
MKNQGNEVVTSVNDADVLSGRGGKTNKHPGNRTYRRIVKENRPRYKQMKSNSHKQLMAESIILCVRNRGGKFLKQYGKDENTWVELSNEEALVKTTQALREIPSGTSSRAFNVERMLELKRKRSDVASSIPVASASSIYSDDRKMPSENNKVAPAAATTFARVRSSVNSNDGTMRPAGESGDDILSDEELECIVNDTDAIDTILSLLDK